MYPSVLPKSSKSTKKTSVNYIAQLSINLPLPVCATPTKSRPDMAIGQVNDCIAVGSSKLRRDNSLRIHSGNPTS